MALLADYGLPGLPVFPEQASEHAAAGRYAVLLHPRRHRRRRAVRHVLLAVFAARYRRRTAADRTPRISGFPLLEWGWTLGPLRPFAVMFGWGFERLPRELAPAAGFLRGVRRRQAVDVEGPAPRRAARDQRTASAGRPAGEGHAHLRGRDPRLRHPGVPVEDRRAAGPLRRDVVSPDARPARYHLFCDQYCGTGHPRWSARSSCMRAGRATRAWLRERADGVGGAREGGSCSSSSSASAATAPTRTRRAPRCWKGCTAARCRSRAAARSCADDDYIRESILIPAAKVVEGWEPIMPTFQGQVTEEEVLQLIAYIQSLGRGETPLPNNAIPPPVGHPPSCRTEGGAEA